jgi:hypothetical protein
MNGRVYDYNLGRFMSVDPLIQSPTSTQSINPYSYIMNNPLAGTDPTGYEGVMTGSRIEGVDTGASGASFGAKAEMGGSAAKSNATITSNGANNYTLSIQLDKKTTLEVDFKVNDIGSLGAKNAMWTDQYGDPSSIPAGFNGTETAYNDAGGDSRLTPFGVSVAQDQAIRSDAAGQAGFAGAVLLTGGALSAYIGAEAVGLVFIAGSGGDITDVALARLPVAKGAGNIPFINGRKPINSQYAGSIHPSGVKFNEQGFPDFSPYSKAQVDIKGLTGSYAKDAAMANKAVGLKRTPDGYTWHHVENAKTMQLISKDIHNGVRHTGGAAVLRNQ